jgi:peptide/nickel transport system permease protein
MCGRKCRPAEVAAVEHRLELDRPLVAQYWAFVSAIFVGRTYGEGELALQCPAPCLGFSFRSGVPVMEIVERALPVTASIVAGSAVIWLGVGVLLGVVAARRRDTVFDRLAGGVSMAASSIQVFFLGLVLLLVFRYQLGWVPNPGYTSPFVDPFAWAAGMILPWCTLGLLFSAVYIRLVRAKMLETLTEDYIRTARAKGVRERTIYYRHALRASLSPIVTLAGLDMQGLGRAAVEAVDDMNLPVVMATVLIAAFFIVVANVVVDILYALIDPRVKLG